MTFLPPFLPDSPVRTARPPVCRNVYFDGSSAPVFRDIPADMSSVCGSRSRVESHMIQGILEAKLEAARRTHELRKYLAQSQAYAHVRLNHINSSTQIPCSPPGKGHLMGMRSIATSFPSSPIKSIRQTLPIATSFPSSPIKSIRQTLPNIVSPLTPPPREKVRMPASFTQALPKPVSMPLVTGSETRTRLYIDRIEDSDVLCGRGGKSNHHPGNKRYRQVISDMKLMYRGTDVKNVKTDLSRAIVDYVCKYGGRFVKREECSGKYYLLTKAEARKKTSQALRETKELKWIN